MMETTLQQSEGGGKVIQHRPETDDVIGNVLTTGGVRTLVLHQLDGDEGRWLLLWNGHTDGACVWFWPQNASPARVLAVRLSVRTQAIKAWLNTKIVNHWLMFL